MVDTSAMVRRGHPIAFTLLAFWSFIVAVIASTLTSDFNKNNNSPNSETTGSTRFLVFTGWWTFLFSVIYLGLFLTGIGGVVTSIAGHGAWLFLTWLFFLAGAGAISDAVGSSSHCKDMHYPYCNSLEAMMAFSWIAWIQLTIMLVVLLVIGFSAFRGGRSVKEGLSS